MKYKVYKHQLRDMFKALEVRSIEEAIEAINLLKTPFKKSTTQHQTEYLETKLSELKEREQRLKAVVLPKLDDNFEKEPRSGLEKLEFKLADM